jgi:hypothetical protein
MDTLIVVVLLVGIIVGLILAFMPPRRQFRVWQLFAFIALVGSLLALGHAAIRIPREAAVASACHGRLYKVALALDEYHYVHHTLLPLQTIDRQGKLVSWPELLAPLLLDAHFEAIGFLNESFRCTPRAKFLLAAGPQTTAQDPPITREQVTDGLENTLVLLEVPASARQPDKWELTLRDLDGRDPADEAASATRVHSAGSGLIFADGAIYRLSQPLSVAQLRALLTIDGGEPITRAQLERDGYLVRISDGPRAHH